MTGAKAVLAAAEDAAYQAGRAETAAASLASKHLYVVSQTTNRVRHAVLASSSSSALPLALGIELRAAVPSTVFRSPVAAAHSAGDASTGAAATSARSAPQAQHATMWTSSSSVSHGVGAVPPGGVLNVQPDHNGGDDDLARPSAGAAALLVACLTSAHADSSARDTGARTAMAALRADAQEAHIGMSATSFLQAIEGASPNIGGDADAGNGEREGGHFIPVEDPLSLDDAEAEAARQIAIMQAHASQSEAVDGQNSQHANAVADAAEGTPVESFVPCAV